MQLKAFLPAILWLLVLTYLSVSSGVKLPKIDLFSPDKIGHAGAYALLVWLILRGIWKAQNKAAGPGTLWLVFGFATAYGALMEWVQGTFFPGRFFEYDDMLANSAGAFLAVMIASQWFKNQTEKNPHN